MLTEPRDDPVDALRIADQRMYANKRRGRRTATRPCTSVLLRVVGEHDGALREHVDDVAELAERGRRRSSASTTADAARRPPRRRAARHRQGRDPRRDPPRPARADRGRVGVHAPAHDHRRAHHRRRAGAAPASPRSSAPATSAGTAAATRTGSPARRSRSAPGSSPSATPTTRSSPTAPTATALSPEAALAELRRCAGTQFDPRVVARLRARARAAQSARTKGCERGVSAVCVRCERPRRCWDHDHHRHDPALPHLRLAAGGMDPSGRALPRLLRGDGRQHAAVDRAAHDRP